MNPHDQRCSPNINDFGDGLDNFAALDRRAKVDPLGRGCHDRLALEAQRGDTGGAIHQRVRAICETPQYRPLDDGQRAVREALELEY